MKTLILMIFLGFIAAGCSTERPAPDPYLAALGVDPVILAQQAHELDALHKREQARVQRGLASRELVVGMRPDDVRTVWGDPREVETAGDNSLGNQRWVYYDGFSFGLSASTPKMVYFENGRVVGWRAN
ncbi:MAG: hypothetical protein ACXVBW_02925 [Bdellovibrionota bacterium]